MSSEAIYGLSALITGIGGLVSAYLTRKWVRKECEERIELLREGLKLGRGLGS